MLMILPRCTMSLRAETAQQLHHVVIVFLRRIAYAEYPVEQIGVSAIEKRLESPEMIAIQGPEGVLGERAENAVAHASRDASTETRGACSGHLDVRDLRLAERYVS